MTENLEEVPATAQRTRRDASPTMQRRCTVAIALIHLIVGPLVVAAYTFSEISKVGWDAQDPGTGPPDILFLSLPIVGGLLAALLARPAIGSSRLRPVGLLASLGLSGLNALCAAALVSLRWQPNGPPVAGGDVIWAASMYASFAVAHLLLMAVPFGRRNRRHGPRRQRAADSD